MTTKELLYVKTIAEEKSISRAARKLFIAQPSLSQSVQRIEESLGTPLFTRTNSGLVPTYAGERYCHLATQILKMYEDFQLEISDINNLRTGRVHVGITNHLGTLMLARVLPEYRKIGSFIELYVHEESSTRLEQMILSGEIGFAVMHAPRKTSQPLIRYDFMGRDPFVIAIAPGHRLIREAVEKPGYPYPVLDLKLLKQEPFIMLRREQRIRQITDAVLEKAGIHQPTIALTLKSFETAQLLAAQGLGVTLVPLQYSTIASPQYRPALLCIDQQYGAYWDLCIASLQNGFLSKADQLFIRIVQQQYGDPRRQANESL